MAMVAALAGSSLFAASFRGRRPVGSGIPVFRHPPKFAIVPAACSKLPPSQELGGSALAGALFASLASSDSAWAAQQVMELAANDNRGVALSELNILKGLAIGVGLGAASALLYAPHALASQEITQIADGDSRGLILLVVLMPAIAWVLYNILQPALNQINRMRSAKAVVGSLGIGGAIMLSSHSADAAVQEFASIADNDSRGLLLLIVLLPALGWVLFNILQPALNQINKMRSKK